MFAWAKRLGRSIKDHAVSAWSWFKGLFTSKKIEDVVFVTDDDDDNVVAASSTPTAPSEETVVVNPAPAAASPVTKPVSKSDGSVKGVPPVVKVPEAESVDDSPTPVMTKEELNQIRTTSRKISRTLKGTGYEKNLRIAVIRISRVLGKKDHLVLSNVELANELRSIVADVSQVALHLREDEVSSDSPSDHGLPDNVQVVSGTIDLSPFIERLTVLHENLVKTPFNSFNDVGKE